MPTFCRHNRFIERCPICAKTLPGNEPAPPGSPRRVRTAGAAQGPPRAGRRSGAAGLRVRHEGRAAEDGYHHDLVPGLRASADAERLAREIGFSSARLAALAADPPGIYAQARATFAQDPELATWTCFLTAYLGAGEGEDPFAAIETAIEHAPGPFELQEELGALLDELPTGPRGSHEPGRGARTLSAYAQWIARAGGSERSQLAAFTGDTAWEAERRFARIFERLALPGLSRAARYETLVLLDRLGLYELRPNSLHLSGPRAAAGEDAATLAAKRVFGIADPLLLDRRAVSLAEAAAVPLESLDLALANWAAEERATLGFPDESDEDATARAERALGI
jgi:hypothetical protein